MILRKKGNQIDTLHDDIEYNEKTLAALTEQVKQRVDELEECHRTINDLEAEIRTRSRQKDKLKADLSNLQISLKREQNNGADAEQTNHNNDVLIRQKKCSFRTKTK